MTNRFFVLALTILISISGVLSAQEVSKQTSYDRFTSQSGKIIRFQDYFLPELTGTYESYPNRVRVLTAGEKSTYYFQVENSDKYGTATGSIEESDLVEMNKAMAILIVSYKSDKSKSIEYLENKYVTNDGVELGYYISKDDSAWYLTLNKYKSMGNTFYHDGDQLQKAILAALEKIKLLKSK